MRFRITPTLTQVHQIHSNASNKWYKQHWRSQFRKQPPMLSHVLKYLLPKIRKDLLTASLSTHRWVYELWLFLKGFGFIQIKKSNLAQPRLQVLTYFKKIYIASLTSPRSANLILTRGADYIHNIAKGQLISEWIYEVIVSPKIRTKHCQDLCPHYTGQKSWQFFVRILGETMTS